MTAFASRALLALLLVVGGLTAVPASAEEGAGFRRGFGERRAENSERFREMNSEQRERRQLRRDAIGASGDSGGDDRRQAMRERWQQMSPDERQNFREQRRQFRQLSPEERQQLRRDILEANRSLPDGRSR